MSYIGRELLEELRFSWSSKDQSYVFYNWEEDPVLYVWFEVSAHCWVCSRDSEKLDFNEIKTISDIAEALYASGYDDGVADVTFQKAPNKKKSKKRVLVDRDQPDWMCKECGDIFRAGEWKQISCWHTDTCRVCGKSNVAVTEPRDCGYLRVGWRDWSCAAEYYKPIIKRLLENEKPIIKRLLENERNKEILKRYQDI